MVLRLLAVAAVLVGTACSPLEAEQGRTTPEGVTKAEAFLRQQLLAGKDVDFNQRCGPFEPRAISDFGRATDCRIIRGATISALLRDPRVVAALPSHGLFLTGIVVKGDVDLRYTSVKPNVFLMNCLFGGKVLLDEASFEHDLHFERSELFSGLEAEAAVIKGRLTLEQSTVRGGKVNLAGAKISDVLEADGAHFDAESGLDLTDASLARVRLHDSTFAAGISADDAEATGIIEIEGATAILGPGLVAKGMTISSFVKVGDGAMLSSVNLTTAHITLGISVDRGARVGRDGVNLEDVSIDGAASFMDGQVAGPFLVDGASFGKGLVFENLVVTGPLSLNRVKVGGDVKLEGSTIAGLAAEKMRVEGSFYLEHDTSNGTVDLKASTIGGDAELVSTSIVGDLALDQSSVGKDLDLENNTTVSGESRFIDVGVGGNLLIGNDPDPRLPPVILAVSHFDLARIASSMFVHDAVFRVAPTLVGTDIKGHLDLAAAQLPGLDMTRATVGGDFRLAARNLPHSATAWSSNALLVLNNAHVGVVQDENELPDGPPWPAKVDLEGFTYEHFGHEPSLDWLEAQWLEKSDFQPSSYARLAKYYADNGRSEQNADLLYAEKVRETDQAWHDCLEHSLGSCAHAVSLSALRFLIGYGIGNRLFWALYWVLGLTVLGAFVLRKTRDAAGNTILWCGRRRLWCFGASINQLIPLVELNPEFKGFFESRKQNHLADWQLIYFAAHAIMGYVLGSFVVAAIAGLTQAH